MSDTSAAPPPVYVRLVKKGALSSEFNCAAAPPTPSSNVTADNTTREAIAAYTSPTAVTAHPFTANSSVITIPDDTPLDCVCLSDLFGLMEQFGLPRPAKSMEIVAMDTTITAAGASDDGGLGASATPFSPLNVNLLGGDHEQLCLGHDTLFVMK